MPNERFLNALLYLYGQKSPPFKMPDLVSETHFRVNTQYVGSHPTGGRGQWMVMLPGSVVCVPVLSVTATVKV